MSETKSFIITIPERLSKILDNEINIGHVLDCNKFDLAMALINRIPIDDVKAEIERLDTESWELSVTDVLNTINRYCEGEEK